MNAADFQPLFTTRNIAKACGFQVETTDADVFPHIPGKSRLVISQFVIRHKTYLRLHVTTRENIASMVQVDNAYKANGWIEREYGKIESMTCQVFGYGNGDCVNVRGIAEALKAEHPNFIQHKNTHHTR